MREGQGGGVASHTTIKQVRYHISAGGWRGVTCLTPIKQVWYHTSDGGGRGGTCLTPKTQVGYNRSNGGGIGGGYMIHFHSTNSVLIIGFYIRYDLYIYKATSKLCITMGCV